MQAAEEAHVFASNLREAHAEIATVRAGLSAELEASMLISLASLSLSLVDTTRRHELLLLRIDAISLSAMSSALEDEAQIRVERIQIDSQLPKALNPVMLMGLPHSTDTSEPWLQANVCRRRMEKRIKRVSLNAQQLIINLDEPVLTAVYQFSARCTPVAPPTTSGALPSDAEVVGGDVKGTPLAIVRSASSELKAPPTRRKRPWYIDVLSLHALTLQLSYRRLPDPTAYMHTGGERGWRPPHMPNVDGLQLQLRAFELEQRFFERRRLLKSLRKHYLAEVRRQVHKVLLHTDVASMVVESSAVARAGRGVFNKLAGGARLIAGRDTPGGREGGASGARHEPATELRGQRVGLIAASSGRLRLPRALIGVAREVRAYNEAEAVGWHYLQFCAELTAQARGEPLMCCVPMADATSLLLLTDMRLACIAVAQPLELFWQIALRDLVAIDAGTDPLSLQLVTADGDAAGAKTSAMSLRLADETSTTALVGLLADQVKVQPSIA